MCCLDLQQGSEYTIQKKITSACEDTGFDRQGKQHFIGTGAYSSERRNAATKSSGYTGGLKNRSTSRLQETKESPMVIPEPDDRPLRSDKGAHCEKWTPELLFIACGEGWLSSNFEPRPERLQGSELEERSEKSRSKIRPAQQQSRAAVRWSVQSHGELRTTCVLDDGRNDDQKQKYLSRRMPVWRSSNKAETETSSMHVAGCMNM